MEVRLHLVVRQNVHGGPGQSAHNHASGVGLRAFDTQEWGGEGRVKRREEMHVREEEEAEHEKYEKKKKRN